MPSDKLDAEKMRRFLKALKEASFIKHDERNVWPNYVYHYTNITNAVQILSDGYLFSRERLNSLEKSFVDSGSIEVLKNTDQSIKNYVRLYFRPKTPTQYHCEGIQSRITLTASDFSGAHCPVPIFFLFDSAEVLTKINTKFSNGNLGAFGVQKYNSTTKLIELPWKRIYHLGPIENNRKSIIFHRHAEVIVPDKLDLQALRLIYCRSDAERESLLHLLPSDVRTKYQGIITASSRNMLFYRKHSFVEKVFLSKDIAIFQFSPDTKSPGPFDMKVTLSDSNSGRVLSWETNRVALNKLNVPFGNSIQQYEIRLFLDGNLAYANNFEDSLIPF